MSATAKTEETFGLRFLADGELAGGTDYTYVIYSSTRTRWWSLHGRKKHGSSSPMTMADGSDGTAVRLPTPAKARQSDGFLVYGEVQRSLRRQLGRGGCYG